MNDNPRTDAIAHRGYNESAYIAEMTGLSRQLERENQTFRAAQKACEDCDAPRVDRIAELERELAESAQSLAFQTQLNREVIELEKKTFAELAAEREQITILRSDQKRLVGFTKTYRLRADEAEAKLEQERQDRRQAELDVCRALGERNDARAELASLKATIADPDEVELAMIRGEIAIPHRVGFDAIRETPVGYNPSPTDP
jgi:hypothetical protein